MVRAVFPSIERDRFLGGHLFVKELDQGDMLGNGCILVRLNCRGEFSKKARLLGKWCKWYMYPKNSNDGVRLKSDGSDISSDGWRNSRSGLSANMPWPDLTYTRHCRMVK